MPAYLLFSSFIEKITASIGEMDTWLFLKINTEWNSPFFDGIFPWWREANTWIPLYLFFIVLAILNFKDKAFYWILFIVLTATITDQTSSNLLKNIFERVRPCRDPNLAGQVRLLLNNCSGGFSFPSSHATNHFGFAMFIFITLQPVLKKWGYLFFV
ncbi:MAG: hypothetical protein RLZZ28_2190, partial [Bacteroidota bacterium]